MGFLDRLLNSLNESARSASRQSDRSATIKCAACGSMDIQRPERETIVCQSCGKHYTLYEARKTMGTPNCRNCIYHSINLYSGGMKEHCVIWGLDKCRSNCDRKETKPPHRWTDANRWEKD